MKKALVLLAVLFSLALVTSVYAQKWDETSNMAEKLAKGKEFKVVAEVVSVDGKANTALLKGPAGKTAIGRFDFAKYEGAYKGVADLKAGDKIGVLGVTVDGYNWVTRVVDADKLPAPKAAPAKK